MEIKVINLDEYAKIEINDLEININGVKKIVIEKEDNGKKVILVESKQQ